MKIAVSGAAGAMGRRVIALIAVAEDLELVAAVERNDHPDLGKDAGMLACGEALGVPLSGELSGRPEVVVDFSAPAGAMACARACAERGVPLAIGTTGLSDQDRAEIADSIAARIPVLLAANMSVGVNLLMRLVRTAASALPGYDVEIVEAHHRRKKDAPSGTARELARVLLETLGRGEGDLTYGRQGLTGPRGGTDAPRHEPRCLRSGRASSSAFPGSAGAGFILDAGRASLGVLHATRSSASPAGGRRRTAAPHQAQPQLGPRRTADETAHANVT